MQRTDLKELIREAIYNDLEVIASLAKVVRSDMVSKGLNQWVGDYPNIDNFRSDLDKGGLFVLVEADKIVGSCSILKENDIAYKEVVWNGKNALVIHRILIDPTYQGKGFGKEMVNFAYKKVLNEGYDSLKIDTHPDNIKMQKMLKGLSFEFRGYLASINRLAYEKLV
jgi:RimJ/RimL family protein N-acetyltransferase